MKLAREFRTLLSIIFAAIFLLRSTPPEANCKDHRKCDSTSWIHAVGKLTVPSTKLVFGEKQHYEEKCAGTLIGKEGAESADWIVTAWHCLENYSDLSRSIQFQLKDNFGKMITTVAHRKSAGGGMHADWALLKLSKKINQSRVISLNKVDRSISTGDAIFFAKFLKTNHRSHREFQLVSRECNVTQIKKEISITDCNATNGDSGSPIIATSKNGYYSLAGIISEGNEVNVSSFVPARVFWHKIEEYIK